MTSKVTDEERAVDAGLPAHVGDLGAAESKHVEKVAQRDWLSGFDEPEPKVHESILVERKPDGPGDEFEAAVLEMDREIWQRAAQNVSGALRWAEVELPVDGEPMPAPPKAWIEQYGPEQAKVMHRIATMANVPKNKMPAGMHVAMQVYVGLVKAHSEKKENERPLNLTLVHIETSDRNYPEKLL